MWRPTPRLATATLTATLAFAFALATCPLAGAASVQTYAYDTSGSISGPSGNVPITFQPETYTSSLATPGSVVLGDFITNPLPSTATLTYNNTPFSITLYVGSFNVPNSYAGPANETAYKISGMLNGTIGGDGSSSMMATVNAVTTLGSGTPPFPVSDLVFSTQGIAAPNGSQEGITAFTAQILVAGLPISSSSSGGGPGSPKTAPEPSTIAVFGLALAGFAWRQRSRSRAGHAGA
jgi:hypothetical protein